MATPLGQPVTLTFRTFSDADRTTPADPTSVTVSVLDPAGDLTDLSGSVSNPSVGVYELLYQPAAAGHYEAHWVATGAVATAFDDAFDVRAAYSQVVQVSDIRRKALNKTLPDDDEEIADILADALDAYAEHVGPLPGEVVEYHDGGGDKIVLRSPYATSLVSAAYSDGTEITTADLSVRDGMLRWGYNTTGYFTRGSQNVVVTYVVGLIPGHHRRAIVDDVAGYFSASQRGGGAGPSFSSEGYEAPLVFDPIKTFPRIMALRPSAIA